MGVLLGRDWCGSGGRFLVRALVVLDYYLRRERFLWRNLMFLYHVCYDSFHTLKRLNTEGFNMALSDNMMICPNLEVITKLEADTAVRHMSAQMSKYGKTVEDKHEVAHRYILTLDNSRLTHKLTAKGNDDYSEIQAKYADVIQACMDYQDNLS